MYKLHTLLECVDMGYKRTGKPYHESEHYADGKSLKSLARYLCSMAKPEGSKAVMVDMCRICESKCQYGKRYVRLYDAAAAEKKQVPAKRKATNKPKQKPAQREPETEDHMVAMTNAELQRQVFEDEIKALTEKLEAQTQECAKMDRSMKLMDVLILEYREGEEKLTARAEAAEAKCAKLEKQLAEADNRYAELESIKDEYDRACMKERQLVAKLTEDNEALLRTVCEQTALIENANEAEREARREVSRLMEKILSLKVWILHRLYPEIAEI